MENLSITTILEQPQPDVYGLWYDWFCKDSSLIRKGEALLKKLRLIAKSDKFDNDKCYVFFKNNCPFSGSLYDDFRICDLETGDVLYTVVPKSGHTVDNGKGYVWGKENGFEEPLFEGTWGEIKRWFLGEKTAKKPAIKTYTATFWRSNPQLKNGGYETTRTIEARNLREAQKRVREIEDGCAYGGMTLRKLEVQE